MRILHVISAVAPIYGGPSSCIWPTIAALRGLGDLTVDLAATDANGRGRRFMMEDLPLKAGPVQLFKRLVGETFKYSPCLARWLAAHAGDYDVIHVHGLWNYPTAAAGNAARRAKVPYVVTPHGMLSRYSWQRSRWKKRAYWWLTERNNVLQAAGFHVTSSEEQRDVLRLGIKAPVEIILHGLGNEAWETPIDAGWLRQQIPQAANRPIVLFLARLHPVKGIVDYLLPAFSRFKTDAFLAIAGGEDTQVPGFQAQVEARIRQLGISDRVSLLGPISLANRWGAFDGAAVFVLPSHWESFGMVVPEAMSRGVPVVATSGVQVAEHVTASGGGTVVPLQVEAIARALDDLLADTGKRRLAGENGRQYARQTFSWNRAAEQLAELYRRVAR